MSRRWYFHACVLDRECRSLGAPWRAHLTTPWWYIAVAFRRRDKFVKATQGHEALGVRPTVIPVRRSYASSHVRTMWVEMKKR